VLYGRTGDGNGYRLISLRGQLTAMMMSMRSDDEDCCGLPSPRTQLLFPFTSPDAGAYA